MFDGKITSTKRPLDFCPRRQYDWRPGSGPSAAPHTSAAPAPEARPYELLGCQVSAAAVARMGSIS